MREVGGKAERDALMRQQGKLLNRGAGTVAAGAIQLPALVDRVVHVGLPAVHLGLRCTKCGQRCAIGGIVGEGQGDGAAAILGVRSQVLRAASGIDDPLLGLGFREVVLVLGGAQRVRAAANWARGLAFFVVLWLIGGTRFKRWAAGGGCPIS